MSRTLGGQQRTAIMPCGKMMIGHPREVNKRVAIHIKLCSTCQGLPSMPTAFNPQSNDKANITVSRRGNITKCSTKHVSAVSDTTRAFTAPVSTTSQIYDIIHSSSKPLPDAS